jgi:hypothetical protein
MKVIRTRKRARGVINLCFLRIRERRDVRGGVDGNLPEVGHAMADDDSIEPRETNASRTLLTHSSLYQPKSRDG